MSCLSPPPLIDLDDYASSDDDTNSCDSAVKIPVRSSSKRPRNVAQSIRAEKKLAAMEEERRMEQEAMARARRIRHTRMRHDVRDATSTTVVDDHPAVPRVPAGDPPVHLRCSYEACEMNRRWISATSTRPVVICTQGCESPYHRSCFRHFTRGHDGSLSDASCSYGVRGSSSPSGGYNNEDDEEKETAATATTAEATSNANGG